MAFVEFYNVEDAKRVKAFVNSSDLWKGTIQFAKKNAPKKKPKKKN